MAVIFRVCVVLAKVSFGAVNFRKDLFFVSHRAWELSHLCQRCSACVWVIYFYVCIYLQAVLNAESMSLFERRNLSRLFWLVKFLCLQIYYTPCIFIFICNDKRKIYGKIFTIIVENIENSDIYTSASQIMCVVCIRHVCMCVVYA